MVDVCQTMKRQINIHSSLLTMGLIIIVLVYTKAVYSQHKNSFFISDNWRKCLVQNPEQHLEVNSKNNILFLSSQSEHAKNTIH